MGQSLPGLFSLMRAADSDLLGVELENRSVAAFMLVRADDDADAVDVKLSTGGGSKRSYFKTRLQFTLE